MDYKPADVFIGVTDLFSVLLPGAIIVALGYPLVDPSLLGLLIRTETAAAQWTAFVLAAYLFGHLLFLLGATIDTPVYDPLRRYWIPMGTDQLFDAAKALRPADVGRIEGLNTYQWARATLRFRSLSALADVDRHEADSKFFRSLFVMLYAIAILSLTRTLSACGRAAPACAERTSMIVALAVVLAPTAVMFIVALLRRGAQEPQEPRWYVPSLALLVVLALVVMFRHDLIAFSAFSLSLLCLWRFAERRWKSNKLAYQYVVVMASMPPQPGGGESVA